MLAYALCVLLQLLSILNMCVYDDLDVFDVQDEIPADYVISVYDD